MGFPTKSDTNRAVQPQKMVRDLKFRIYEVEGLYYPCSENKCADQLRGCREADLRLCFRICKKSGFLITRLIYTQNKFCITYKDVCIFVLVEKLETNLHLEEPYYLLTKTWAYGGSVFGTEIARD